MSKNTAQKILHIGFGNIIMTDKVIALLAPDSAPIKRLISESRERGRLIDVTHGRRTRSVIVTDNEYIMLSALQTETLAGRLNNAEGPLPVVTLMNENDLEEQ